MLRHRLNTLRESRILWHFIEPSFAFCASLSHSLPPSLLSLYFLLYTPSFKQNQKEHTTLDYSIKEGVVFYNSLLY